jgi:glycosyltransferase involved in cell wall biosynthesis
VIGSDATVTGKPRLLYLSPLTPADAGNGMAMRAAQVLRALTAHYAVTLRVLPIAGSPSTQVSPLLTSLCESSEVLPDSGSHLAGESFDVVHLLGLTTLSVVQRVELTAGRNATAWHLDLCDIESTLRGRLAALYRANGEVPPAAADQHAAELAYRAEALVLRTFDRVYVCSELDRTTLAARGQRAELRVLPNSITLPVKPPPPLPGRPFTLLFVGWLGYYPNEDGVRFFCERVLPLLRRAAPRPFRVRLVGAGAPPSVTRLAELAEVELIGPVADLAPYYAAADAAIVPLRAGGGTRIKILEAFAYHRPVISTTLGAEGLEARANEHLLLGDSPDELAERCLRLMQEPGLSRHLVRRAADLVRQRYTLTAQVEAVRP